MLVDIATFQDLVDENEALKDVIEGLRDLMAGRVMDHDEARAELLRQLKA